jgi:hypothetical protein
MAGGDLLQTVFTRAQTTLLSFPARRNDPENPKSHFDGFTSVLYYSPIASEHKINQA